MQKQGHKIYAKKTEFQRQQFRKFLNIAIFLLADKAAYNKIMCVALERDDYSYLFWLNIPDVVSFLPLYIIASTKIIALLSTSDFEWAIVN